jgi:hypothetical protein
MADHNGDPLPPDLVTASGPRHAVLVWRFIRAMNVEHGGPWQRPTKSLARDLNISRDALFEAMAWLERSVICGSSGGCS